MTHGREVIGGDILKATAVAMDAQGSLEAAVRGYGIEKPCRRGKGRAWLWPARAEAADGGIKLQVSRVCHTPSFEPG